MKEQGCRFSQGKENHTMDSENEEDFFSLNHPMTDLITVLEDSRSRRNETKCSGKLLFETDDYGRHLIR